MGKVLFLIYAVLIVVFFSINLQAQVTNSIKVISLSENDNVALIEDANGEMLVTRKGALLPNTNYLIKSVLSDKIVLRNTTTDELLWLLKSVNGQPSELKRISKELDSKQLQPELNVVTHEINIQGN